MVKTLNGDMGLAIIDKLNLIERSIKKHNIFSPNEEIQDIQP